MDNHDHLEKLSYHRITFIKCQYPPLTGKVRKTNGFTFLYMCGKIWLKSMGVAYFNYLINEGSD